VTFRLANNSLEPTWPAHGYRLCDTNLGLAKRLSLPQLYPLKNQMRGFFSLEGEIWLI